MTEIDNKPEYGRGAMARAINKATPIIFLAAVVVLIFSPLLFMGRAFFDEEQIGFYYPMSAYYQRALENGDSLLWNGGYYGGVSASLDQFASPFDPIKRVIFTYLDLFNAHHWSITIAVFAGVLLAYIFGRVQGWSYASSFVLALGYLLATKLGWLSVGTIAANSFIVFPGVALALLLAHKSRSMTLAILVGGAALGFGLLSGFSQIVFYNLFLLGIYAIYLDWEHWIPGRRWHQNFRAVLLLLGILLLGSIISIRQTFPSAYFIELTVRQAHYAIESTERLPPAHLITWVLPDYIQFPFLGGGSNGFSIGVIPFAIIILALVLAPSRKLFSFLALYLIPLGFTLSIPPFSWINNYLPPFSHMRGNLRWMVSAAFPLACLAAASIETFIEKGIAGREKIMRLTARVVAVFVIVLVFVTLASQFLAPRLIGNEDFMGKLVDFHFRGRTATLPASHYLEVAESAVRDIGNQLSFANAWWVIAILMWVGAGGFFYFIARWRPTSKTVLMLIAGAMTVNVFAVFSYQYHNFIPQEIMLQTPALVNFLKNHEPNPRRYRIMGFLIGDGMFREVLVHSPMPPQELANMERELLVNNTSVFWEIQRMDGLEPYRTLRHNQLLNTLINADKAGYIFDRENPNVRALTLDRVDNRDALRSVTPQEKIKDFLLQLPLLSMMNVKYIYSLYPLQDPRLTPITIPRPASIPVNIYLYKNTQVLPRIYFAERPLFSKNQGTEFLLEIAEVNDFRHTTVIECNDCVARPVGRGQPPKFVINEYRDGLLSVNTETTADEWLVFSESAMPGWVATVDGVPAKIYTANYLFQAIQVPPGKHQIEWRYEDIFMQKQKALLEYLEKLFR